MNFLKLLFLVIIVSALFLFFQSTPEKIRIGLNQWPGYEPVYAAKVKGLYKKAGLNVEVFEYGSLNDVKTAYERGHIDVMCSTLIEMIKTYGDAGINSKVLFATDFSNGPDVLIANDMPKSGELSGKRIGVELGTLGVYMIHRALEINNLQLSDITIVPLDQTDMLNALQTNIIDVAVTYPPISASILKTVSNSKVIFSSKDIPYEVIDVLVAKDSVLLDHPDLKKDLLGVWDEALELLVTDRETMVKIMAEREKVSPAEFEDFMIGMVYLNLEEQSKLFGPDKLLRKAIESTINILYVDGELKTKISPDLFIQ